MEIDALGTFTVSHAAFQALRSAGDSLIVNISATLQCPATWYQCHASAAKAAIDSLTRSLALEWGAYGIRVMGVAPGPIADTAGMTKLSGNAKDMMLSAIPLGKMGEKADIALACVFLASAAGRFCSGDTFIVDGANWVWKPPVAPREAVSKLSRGVEKKSRGVGLGAGGPPRSKL